MNSPSELPKAYGTIAPVSTIVFPRPASPSTRAVSAIVSVPCVITIGSSAAERQLLEDELAIRLRHLQAVDHHQRAHGELEPAAPELQHLLDVGVLEARAGR